MKLLVVAIAALAALVTVESAPDAAVPSDPVRYEVDPVHSGAVFKIRRGVVHFYGRFDRVDGWVSFDEEDPANSEVEIRIDATSVHTGNEQRDRHLKSPDFFDVEQFETITFRSSKVTALEADNTFSVEGELDLHGVQKSITATVLFTGTGKGLKGEDEAGFDVTMTIDRRDFDIEYGAGILGDEVTVMLGVNAQRK